MYFEFREPCNSNELQALLQLREEVYSQSSLSGGVGTNEARAQFARHDKMSRHFGLFEGSRGLAVPTGYIRITEIFAKANLSTAASGLPSLEYVKNRSSLTRMIHGVLGKHGMMVEAGRLAMLPQARSRHLARFMAECSVALYNVGFESPGIVSCAPHHRRFYESLGFRRVFRNLTGEYYGNPVNLLYLSPRASASARFESMLQVYKQHGAIAYRSDEPGNLVPIQQITTDLSILQAALNVAA